jgi:hypothetical protein
MDSKPSRLFLGKRWFFWIPYLPAAERDGVNMRGQLLDQDERACGRWAQVFRHSLA